MKSYAALILLAISWLCFTSYVKGQSSSSELDNELQSVGSDSSADGENEVNKRLERSGIDSRSYTYNNGNGVKRLPVYNFGLGKRARPYSFGLGKRGGYSAEDQYDDGAQQFLAVLYPIEPKRSRPYSFGLGKRDENLRAFPPRYGFGLGR